VEGWDDHEIALAHADTTAQTMPPPAEIELISTLWSAAAVPPLSAPIGNSGSLSSNPADAGRARSRNAEKAAASCSAPAAAYSPKLPFVATTGGTLSPNRRAMARAS